MVCSRCSRERTKRRCNRCARDANNIRIRAAIVAAKGDTCLDCKNQWPTYVLDFDHIPERGEKLFELWKARGKTLKQVLAEIAKCDVVCSNCHREREHKRGIE